MSVEISSQTCEACGKDVKAWQEQDDQGRVICLTCYQDGWTIKDAMIIKPRQAQQLADGIRMLLAGW